MSTIVFTGDATVTGGGVANFLLSPDAVLTGGPLDVTHGQPAGVFAPTSVSWAASSAAKAFTWTAPNVPGIYTIHPFGLLPVPWIVSPNSLNITVLGAGASPPVHRIYFPQNFGPPPFGVLTPRDILPAASMPVVPPTVTTYGDLEAGGGTIAGLHADFPWTIQGPLLTEFRDEMSLVVKARADQPFNLNYQFTTDGGTTWWQTSDQVNSSATTPDGGGYTQSAVMFPEAGFQWQIQVFNTSASPLNMAFEWRYSFESVRKQMWRR